MQMAIFGKGVEVDDMQIPDLETAHSYFEQGYIGADELGRIEPKLKLQALENKLGSLFEKVIRPETIAE